MSIIKAKKVNCAKFGNKADCMPFAAIDANQKIRALYPIVLQLHVVLFWVP